MKSIMNIQIANICCSGRAESLHNDEHIDVRILCADTDYCNYGIHSDSPVSYTHLDVYKRQAV